LRRTAEKLLSSYFELICCVYLAMSGAEQAARVVDVALREPRLEARLLRKQLLP